MMRSLYTKIVVITLTIMLLSGLFAFIFSNMYYQQKLKPYNDEKNTNIALNIANYALNESDLERYLENVSALGYQLFIIDTAGNEQFFGDAFRSRELPSDTIDDVLNGEIYHGIAEFPQETFVTGFFANELSNTIGVPVRYQEEQYALFLRPNIKMLFNEIHIMFAWLLLFIIVLSVILVFISTKYVVKPLTELIEATQKLSEGDFSVELEINREDEIGDLAKSFTHMSKQLEKLDEMKNEFIGNISHDIQSPLSNIKGYSNLLASPSLTEKEKSIYIAVINNEINRLSDLTKQLLLLASLDRQENLLQKSNFLLSEQIKEVIYHYQWAIEEKNLMISYTLPESYVHGDPSLLYSVWENLLTNAIKYNKTYGSIDISIKEEKNFIAVRFQDTGIGMSEKSQARIFERFFREDVSRTATVKGSGLGLSIVHSIVTLHGGEVAVESEKDKGSTITIVLPKT
ncbi:MAG TPA: HAMP domain-containing sensor histidine kinase [Pseudogracilibacillus sp.]|nr:HAMP domain-containing sensor histidine kinase [Pseudogracilibacillus sp.]